MKIVEALKQKKDLMRKAEDLRKKIAQAAADLDIEIPAYEDQAEKVKGWLQAHTDISKEILRLSIAIQRTNLATKVTVELGGKAVTKSIAEWIHRRGEKGKKLGLAGLELCAWQQLSDRGLKEGQIKQSSGELRDVKIRRYYSPEQRDKMLDQLQSEPLMVDARLEVANALTDLIE